MRKKYLWTYVILLLSLATACKKNSFLAATVSTNLDSTTVFQDSTKAIQFLNAIYLNIGFASDPKRFTSGSDVAGLESACDEAEGPNLSASNGFTMFATGTVNPTAAASRVAISSFASTRTS